MWNATIACVLLVALVLGFNTCKCRSVGIENSTLDEVDRLLALEKKVAEIDTSVKFMMDFVKAELKDFVQYISTVEGDFSKLYAQVNSTAKSGDKFQKEPSSVYSTTTTEVTPVEPEATSKTAPKNTTPVDGNNQCDDNEFSCHVGGACITKKWVCDGDKDCTDGEDEANCDGTTECRDKEFKCNNSGVCISKAWVCDGQNDCVHGDDEVSCAERTCEVNQFKCKTAAQCINIRWKCDGEADCKDHSDEGPDCFNATPDCTDQEFQCLRSEECISYSWKCDGERDCSDGSDEEEGCSTT